MRTSLFARSILSIVTSALIGCETEAPLLAPEVFHWSGQPVSFRPPPAGWRREGELSGGVRGVRFVKEHGRGEAITVGELHRATKLIDERTLADVVGPLRKERYASVRSRYGALSRRPPKAFTSNRANADRSTAAPAAFSRRPPMRARGRARTAHGALHRRCRHRLSMSSRRRRSSALIGQARFSRPLPAPPHLGGGYTASPQKTPP